MSLCHHTPLVARSIEKEMFLENSNVLPFVNDEIRYKQVEICHKEVELKQCHI